MNTLTSWLVSWARPTSFCNRHSSFLSLSLSLSLVRFVSFSNWTHRPSVHRSCALSHSSTKKKTNNFRINIDTFGRWHNAMDVLPGHTHTRVHLFFAMRLTNAYFARWLILFHLNRCKDTYYRWSPLFLHQRRWLVSKRNSIFKVSSMPSTKSINWTSIKLSRAMKNVYGLQWINYLFLIGTITITLRSMPCARPNRTVKFLDWNALTDTRKLIKTRSRMGRSHLRMVIHLIWVMESLVIDHRARHGQREHWADTLPVRQARKQRER